MNPSNVLRPMLDSDHLTVSAWLSDYIDEHRAWWSQAYGSEPVTPLAEVTRAELEDLIECSRSPAHFVCVSTDGTTDAPLGIVMARIQPDRFMGVDVGTLSWIFVAPGARGSGVARQLMEAAENWFSEQGAAGRAVFVTAANRAAVRLYERHGYRTADHPDDKTTAPARESRPALPTTQKPATKYPDWCYPKRLFAS